MHTLWKSLASRKGQSLVEGMVSLVVLMFVIMGSLELLNRSLSVNRVIADEYIGTYLAAEGIEVVKNIIETNYLNLRAWNTGIAGNGNYEAVINFGTLSYSLAPVFGAPRNLLYNTRFNTYSYTPDGAFTAPTDIHRVVTLEYLNANEEVRVTSRVTWTGGSAVLEDHFFDWRP